MVQTTFSSGFNANVIILLNVELVRADYYTFKNPFKCGIKPYMKACMASSLASSGNATTTLSNAAVYSYTEPRYHSLCNLFLATFL